MESRFPILKKFKKRYYMKICYRVIDILQRAENIKDDLIWKESTLAYRLMTYNQKSISLLAHFYDIVRREKEILDKNNTRNRYNKR